MQNDSMHCTSGTMALNEAASQDSAASFNCSHCVLIFKTRIYLYEHLHQVHGLDSDAALRDSGLKSVALSKPKPDNNFKQSDFAFNCKNCNFKSGNWTIYSEHKKQCSGGGKACIKDSPIDENSTTKGILSNKHKESNETKVCVDKAKQKSNTTDIIKKYTKSPQTITKYFTAASAIKSDYDAVQTESRTLLLEESPSSSSGVFQVTAKSIDMVEGSHNKSYLLNDHFLFTNPTLAKPVDHFKQDVSRNTGKRPAKDGATSIPSKKPKVEIVSQRSNEIQSSSCAELSFEVSEDEEAMDPVCENVEALKAYFCKHCEFSSSNLKHVLTHYEDNHPYIRCNSNYIQKESDHTAMFRCLECPVEYSSETDLQKHYTEDHPEAPNVFSLKSSDLNLVLKCFVCHFTSDILHSLREHYKDKHPSQKMENPLMYCKYSSTSDHSQFAQITLCNEDTRLKNNITESITAPCKEDQGASLLPLKASDGNLYQCGKCIFSHKSVVVLHVHYKKCHPEEAITLDKIKQSTFGASNMDSEQKPILSVDHLCSVKEENSDSENNLTEQRPVAFSPGLSNTSPASHDFFCNLCQFSSQNIRSVISHHNAKHGSVTTNITQILQHNAELRSKHTQNQSASLGKESGVANTSRENPYMHPEDLYYCHVCNYANPNLKGVLNHQSKLHEKNQGTKERVMSYSAMIRDEIEKSKSHPADSILPSGLPLPLIKEEDRNECLFFCHFCNYRHKDITWVSRHYLKMHKGIRITTQKILEHTSIICERLHKTNQMKYIEQSQKVIPANPEKKKYSKIKLTKNLKSVSGSWTQTHGELKCTACLYTSQFLYLIRKHYQQKHKRSLSYSDIVQYCGAGTNLQPGYYCDICSYFHEDVAEVYRHGKQRHAGRSVSRHFILTQLYVGPDVSKTKNIKTNSVNQSDNIDGSSGYEDNKAYSCKACSFKGNSMSSITSHYHTVHPWSVKDDGLVLDVRKCSKKQSPSSKMQVYNDCGETFDSYQMPLEFDTVSIEETKEYCCSYCPAKFKEHGGLLIHLGMKHREEAAEQTAQLEMAKRTKIFKCRSCSYVNNIRQGAFAHTMMKHPNKKVKLDSLYIGSEHLLNVEKRIKNGIWKVCGFMCKVCNQVFSSKEKLKIHRENGHKLPFSHPTKSASRPDGTIHKLEEIWCQHCGLYCGSAVKLTDHLHVCQKNTLYACVLCQNAFSTKVRLGIHYTKKHGKKAFFKHYAPLYNQPSNKSTSADSAQLEKTTHAMSESKTMQMYKCPSCRYVNSVHHGTLTHCQMRHPKVVVRAETLKTAEIHVTDMIGCRSTGRPNYGGYRCKKCPKVYGVLKKLKKHFEADHSRSAAATSELSVESKQQKSVDDNTVSESVSSNQKKPVSKFPHFFKCSLCSYSTLILKKLGNHYSRRHGKSAFLKFYSPLFYQAHKKPKVSKALEETEKTEKLPENVEPEQTTKPVVPPQVYACSICSYGSAYRRYLIAHYRNRHKLDSQAVYKQMGKYSKDKLTTPDGQFQCSKCLDLFFETRWRLLAHYHTFHSSELKMDFTVYANRTHRTTGVFKCCHCTMKIFGLKKLRCHLDRHRETRLEMMTQNAEMMNNKNVSEQDALSSLETMRDETKLNVKTEEKITTKTAPPVSLVKPFGPELSEEPDMQSGEGKHNCLRCKRSFMSLKGLRSHERSHAALAALAAIKKVNHLPTSVIERHIEKYLAYRPGTTRPFMCSICTYRTNVHGLWKGHIIKNHQHVLKSAEAVKQIEETTYRDDENMPNMGEDINALDGDEGPENSYLEPPDVQRQLKHYDFMAQIDSASKTQEISISDPKMLPCEMCNFNSLHISTMRRHYLRHHGKKLIRCKDCNFFTCFRRNLDLHEQMGHSTVQSEPTHQKNLCCPFCLYQSKNKNNMIDHIVLHREERVMPIEVRRSKLSRCLEGVVFRCHRCTFTSGSANNLHLHMAKHNDVKPYKCRLCYFDCSQLRDLEAHLCDKHQVVRNHQLVGQVCMDQMESRDDRISQDNELLYSQNEEEWLKNIPVTLQNDMQNKAHLEDAMKENQKSDPSSKNGEEFTDIPKSPNTFEQSVCERLKNQAEDVQLSPGTEEIQPQMKGREGGPEDSSVCVKTGDPSMFQALSFEANVENDILHHTSELDDNELVEKQSSKVNGETSVTTIKDPQIASEIKNLNVNRSASIDPTSVQLKIQEQKTLCVVSTNCNQGDTHNQKNSAEQTNPYGDMPILEKYFKEQHMTHSNYETSQKLLCDKTSDKCNENRDGANNQDLSQEDHNPPLLFRGVSARDGTADAAALFPCDLCGRNLGNTSELERHIMRHGM